MTDKPGPSKRSGSVLTSGSRAKKGRSFSADSSLDDFECSSEEAVFSQCCDEEEVSDDSSDSIFDTRRPFRHKRMDRFLSPIRQKTSNQVPEETFTHSMSSDRHMSTSPSIIQDYGELPDIPDNLLNTSVPTSISMLMSDATSINFPSEDIENMPPATASLSQTRVVRLDDQPSGEGASSSWSTQGTMKNIEFTRTQELLVPAPSDPFEAFRLLLDDNILDLLVRETNANAIRVLKAPGVKQHSRIISWKDITRTELLTFLGNQMSDPSSEEAWERLLVESLLKLSGKHRVTHHEPLQPVVMQPVKPRTFPVRGPTDRLSYVIRRYDDGVHGRNTRTLTRHNFRPRALAVVYGL
ncbi:unnamed protein product [Parnassius apollo]|uniref:(apollo) hypothetical protein n=1 Tax=Parnassius apollo TaxID=110799 RepID=A0A8S3XU93_PARAO|nr:unnamed protein product [Parnassius apollo]